MNDILHGRKKELSASVVEKGIYDGGIWFAHGMHISFFIKKRNKQDEEALWQSHKDWLWWFSLRRYLMQNVTCFVLQLAHLPAQREDKAFRIWLKRFVFCTFQLPLTWRGSPSPTQCANPRMERKRVAVDGGWGWGGEENAYRWHRIRDCVLRTVHS